MIKKSKVNQRGFKYSLLAHFALAGAMALSCVPEAHAGETSVRLGNGDTATVRGGGTKVETDGAGNVKVYVTGQGSVAVHTGSGVTVRPALNDATATVATNPKAGDRLADGTIFAGNGLSTTPADAPDRYTWGQGKHYCEDLVTNGHEDWHLPSKAELSVLFKNRAVIGGFDTSGSFPAGYYWSSSESDFYYAWLQRFSDGLQTINLKPSTGLRVRCVRG
jgi:hypothetical protein